MNVTLQKSEITNPCLPIQITGSKSESNRLLILQALFSEIEITNLSNSDDTKLLQKALQPSSSNIIDIHHAGTAMRFLTAYFSATPNREVVLTGSLRMKERPIGILVDALRELGADITYLEKDGFPPLQIKGQHLSKSHISLKANVSSQYITALLLIGTKLPNGITMSLDGSITSLPYIKMTLGLLNRIDVKTQFENNIITVKPKSIRLNSQIKIEVESDWSSASYWFSIVALSKLGTKITLASYNTQTLQGDAILVEFYKKFGVETRFSKNTITIQKIEILNPSKKYDINLNLIHAPDIAQTIVVTAFGLGFGCHLTGLHTLKIKETDRLVALKNELLKLDANIEITENSLSLQTHYKFKHDSKSWNLDDTKVVINTYNDHRMAMAFAPLALKTPITIANAEVVSKSYPTFWKDLQGVGFNLV